MSSPLFCRLCRETRRRSKGGLLAQALANQPPVWNDYAVELSFSWGACELRGDLTADAALGEADRNMYSAKREAKTGRSASA